MHVIYNNILQEYELRRCKHRLNSPPRKQRIKSAIVNGRLEDIRSLIGIHFVKNYVKSCTICGYVFNSGYIELRNKFSCQLCNETYCNKCKTSIVLFHGVSVICCIDCYQFYTRVMIISRRIDSEDHILNIFGTYKIVLNIYKDLNVKLLQLNGYIKILSLHDALKEPLPEGTKQSVQKLLKDTTVNKKQLSEIKKYLKNTDNHKCNIAKYVKKSLNTLLTIILYKIIPEFNKVINKLNELEGNKC